MKLRTMLLFLLAFCLAAVALAQEGKRGAAEATVKGKKISIDYGRPTLGGAPSRVGELPVGGVWRLGMDQATHITTAADLTIAGKAVKAGKYTLWVKRNADKTYVLAFHPKTGIWGDPAMQDGFIAELPLKMEQAPTSVDQVTISLAGNKYGAGIKIQWGKDILSGTLNVK